MNSSVCFALAEEGDWEGAIEQALTHIKKSHSALEIAGWLIEAGLSTRDVTAEATRVGHCLNRDKKQFFKLPEFWVIQQRSGLKELFQLECIFLGASIPAEITSEDRMRILKAQEDEVLGILNRIRTLQSQCGSRVGRQFFSLPRFKGD